MNKQLTLRHWSLKFRNAFRGIQLGIYGQSSFYAHFLISTLVFVSAVFLKVNLVEWCLLLLCMGLVLSAELLNSAMESLAKAITNERDDYVRDALDIASGAVLMASFFAAVVGATILIFRLGLIAGFWGGYLLL